MYLLFNLFGRRLDAKRSDKCQICFTLLLVFISFFYFSRCKQLFVQKLCCNQQINRRLFLADNVVWLVHRGGYFYICPVVLGKNNRRDPILFLNHFGVFKIIYIFLTFSRLVSSVLCGQKCGNLFFISVFIMFELL